MVRLGSHGIAARVSTPQQLPGFILFEQTPGFREWDYVSVHAEFIVAGVLRDRKNRSYAMAAFAEGFHEKINIDHVGLLPFVGYVPAREALGCSPSIGPRRPCRPPGGYVYFLANERIRITKFQMTSSLARGPSGPIFPLPFLMM